MSICNNNKELNMRIRLKSKTRAKYLKARETENVK